MKTKTGKLLMQLKSKSTHKNQTTHQPQFQFVKNDYLTNQKIQLEKTLTNRNSKQLFKKIQSNQNHLGQKNNLIKTKPNHIKQQKSQRTQSNRTVPISDYLQQQPNHILAQIYKSPTIKQNQRQIQQLRNQTQILKHEIQKLKQKNAQLQQNLLRNKHQNELILREYQEKAQISNQNHQSSFIEKQKQNLLKLQQKNKNLQLQNYRLIEQNFILMLNIKNNIKKYKQIFLKVINKLENLQYAQASQVLFDVLTNMKQDQKNTQNLNKQIFPQKNKQYKSRNLRLISQTFLSKYIPVQNTLKSPLKQRISSNTHTQTKNQQFTIEPFRQYNRNQNQNFHLIQNDSKFRSSTDFYNRQKGKNLFHSDVKDFQIENRFQQASINQKIQGQAQNNMTKKFKQYVIHKSSANCNQLYKMLLLQASALEQFF